MEKYLLGICVISHRQTHFVSRLLDSIEQFKPNFRFKVFVLENIKGYEPLEFSKYSFEISYQQNEVPQGLSANINQVYGLIGQDSKYFSIMNPDIVFTQKLFEILFQVMEEYQIDIISPLILDKFDNVQDSFRQVPTPLEISRRYLGYSKFSCDIESLPEITYPDWFGAMFMLMQSKMFETIGGFNQKYWLYFEDVEFCIRAQLMGYKLGVYKHLDIRHDAQRKSHKKISYLYHHIVSGIRFFRSDVYKEFIKSRG